jgi:hypothetical protein
MKIRWFELSNAVGLALIFFFSFAIAQACSCSRPSAPCEAYSQVDAIFVGMAKDITWIETEEKLEGKIIKRLSPAFTFLVNQGFRGVVEEQIWIHTGMGGGDCGYVFKLGEQYLVYSYRNKSDQKKLMTSICTRTRPIAQAQEDLEYLNGLLKASPKSRIYGEVLNYSQRGEPAQRTTYEGVAVTVEGGGKSYSTKTDQDGKYSVSGLAEGDYKVRISPPKGFTDWTNEREVKVTRYGCAQALFHLRIDGRISGKVVDANGAPLSNAYINLYAADRKRAHDGYSEGVASKEDGRYEFKAVPAGNYKLKVVYSGRPEDLKPFPPLDYSGVVSLGQSARVEGVDFQFPVLTERTVEGALFWPDGKPAAKVELICSMEGGRIRAPIKLDEQGRFSFKGYEGVELVLFAHTEIEKGKRLVAEKPIAAQGDFKDLKLFLQPRTY